MENKQKNYVLPIAMMFALFFIISFVTGLQNPMGIIVKKQFGTTNLMSQFGNAANFIAYAFMGIPAGLLLKRIGYKKTALYAIIVGITGISISLFSGQVESFAVFILGAFISGCSMCMLNTVVNPMLNTLGGGGNKGNQLIQFGGAINSIGATIVPVFLGYLIGNLAQANINSAKPALFLAIGIFATVFVVLYFVNIPEPHMETKEAAKVQHTHSALSFRHFIFGAICIFLYVGVEVGIPNFAFLYLTSTSGTGGLAIDTTTAGSVVGTYWFLMLIGRLCGGSLGAKFSSKAMLAFVSTLGCIFILAAIFCPADIMINMPVFQSTISFGLAKVPVSIMFLILCGLCTSVMWGGIFNLAVEGLGKYTASAAGFFMVMVAGGGILPLVQGFAADSFGYISSYWVIFASLIFMLYYALAGSRNVNKDIPVE